MNEFNKWLDVFIEEKEIDLERVYEFTVNDVWNYMPIGVVIEFIKQRPDMTKQMIKDTLVKIDFLNGDIHDFLKYLAIGSIKRLIE